MLSGRKEYWTSYSYLPGIELLQNKAGRNEKTGSLSFPADTVAPNWELGGRGRPIFFVAPAELEYPEHAVRDRVIVQMLQTLALKEI